MSKISSQKIKVVGAVLIDNNKILLTQRSSNCHHYPDFFEFPGGKVENQESEQQAIIRELEEELSIIVNFDSLISFPDNQIETEKIILTLFIIKKWEGNLQINPKIHTKVIKIDACNLLSIDKLIDNDKLLINSIQKYLLSSG